MTSLLAVKLHRDLRATWSPFLLMVIAIAVSLTVFGGVLAAWATTGRETGSTYMGTEPASATIVFDRGVSTEQMASLAAAVRTRPGVIAATGRTQFTGEVAVNGVLRDVQMQVFVAAPNDPMRMAKFNVREGSWPPEPGEIYIGRDSLTLLDVTVGDNVTVKTPGGERVRLQVAGTVYDPSLAPAPQEQTGHGYLSTAALAAPGAQVSLDQLKIQVADPGESIPSRSRETVVAVAGDAAKWLQREYGLSIREIQVPRPYAHPHQWQTDSLLLSLLAGGAIALLLSTILVSNMLGGLFTRQIPQIGIMKAIGARSGHIGRLYLAMTLLVAAAATLVALAPAAVIGRAGSEMLLGFLGIEAASLAAPWWAYLVILAAGLSLPPLMALSPLIRASRTTVRAAIDHRGLGTDTGAGSRALAWLSRFHGLDGGLLMALRNTVRRPARFLLAVSLLASAGTVFIAGISLSDGVKAIEHEMRAQRNWDVDVQLAAPAPADEVISLITQVPGVVRTEGWVRAQSGVAGPGAIPLSRTYPDQGHGRISVTAVPAGSTMLPPPRLLEGRWLNPGETGAVVLNQIARHDTVPDVHAGDTVQLFVTGKPTTWRVVGIVEERGGHGAVYTTAEGFASAMGQPQWVNQLRIATDGHDEETRKAVTDAMGKALSGAGIAVQSAASVGHRDAVTAGHLGPVIAIVLAIAIAMGVVGGIGLASTMSANILDRTREFGVMHAIGARPEAVRRIVAAEGVFVALASCLAAVIPALALSAILGAGLGNLFMYAPLPFRFSFLAAGIWTALAILGALLATEAAATRAARLTVRAALAYM
ncbi:MAG TPA: FtsX-like permease family protein [Symbiobacteriaceae bacterium]|nr:FtsX-like permease family protein [Symbiobacteriaceae bacterium]